MEWWWLGGCSRARRRIRAREVCRERSQLLLEQLIQLGKKYSQADKLLGSQVLIWVLNRNS